MSLISADGKSVTFGNELLGLESCSAPSAGQYCVVHTVCIHGVKVLLFQCSLGSITTIVLQRSSYLLGDQISLRGRVHTILTHIS